MKVSRQAKFVDITKLFSKVIRALSSVKLAVFVILGVAGVSAVGTFIESHYQDLEAAQKLVYQTWWNWGILGLLAINLTAVLIDRWPWKRRHLSFVLAHIGILILLGGSLLTYYYGIDGTMRVGLNDSSRFVSLPTRSLTVWSSFDGERFTKIFEKPVDFFLNPPRKNSLTIPTDAGSIEIFDYYPYALGSMRFVASEDERLGAGIQVSIRGQRLDVIEWLTQDRPDQLAELDLGPAVIYFGEPRESLAPLKNHVILTPTNQNLREFTYQVRNPIGDLVKSGQVKELEPFQPGWMDFEIRILQAVPRGRKVWEYRPNSHKTEVTTSALKLRFQGQEHFVELGDILRLFTDQAVYFLNYSPNRIQIGFDVHLKEFRLGKYPGTLRASSYESLVEVDGLGEVLISMNEPLKHQGLTLYQASYQEGRDGVPVASIFSVNYDPGRGLKYLGSLILSLGVVVLFYDRRKKGKAEAMR
jgi:hypothetical protein